MVLRLQMLRIPISLDRQLFQWSAERTEVTKLSVPFRRLVIIITHILHFITNAEGGK
jgi:hypothetical protein